MEKKSEIYPQIKKFITKIIAKDKMKILPKYFVMK